MAWKLLYNNKCYTASVYRTVLDQNMKDVSRDLQLNKMKKYREHLETLILTITQTMNPFWIKWLSLGLN